MSDTNHFSYETRMALLVRHMKPLSQADRLQSLMAALEHFNQSPDFGDSESVAAIRRHLMIRIREAESAMYTETKRATGNIAWYERRTAAA
jgi:hypothetical protein